LEVGLFTLCGLVARYAIGRAARDGRLKLGRVLAQGGEVRVVARVNVREMSRG